MQLVSIVLNLVGRLVDALIGAVFTLYARLQEW